MEKHIRKWIARLLPGRFPALYSTLDNPVHVPAQEAAYQLAVQRYIRKGDRVLDVGFGLAYGLEIMAAAGGKLSGIDIDYKVVKYAQRLVKEFPGIEEIRVYDGKTIPYPDRSFDIITCVDVIEHVPNYLGLIEEMVRVSKNTVLISTPNRRPEYTKRSGRPRNPWHLREWTFDEFQAVLHQVIGVRIEWSFLDGPWGGPFKISSTPSTETISLVPVLLHV
jgi:2-polyprenyl-3-methyl-5-hydroxy-6-metoxy-1,4-benzoquinol methylase